MSKNEPKSKLAMGCALMAFALLAIVIAITTCGDDEKKPNEVKNEEQTSTLTKDQIQAVMDRRFNELKERIFDSETSECKPLVKLIKRSLFDPDSYRHISTRYEDSVEGYFIVMTIYKAKTLNGEWKKCFVQAKVWFDEETIEIIDEG